MLRRAPNGVAPAAAVAAAPPWRPTLEWTRVRRTRTQLYSTIAQAAVDALRERDSDRVAATVAAAERVRRHEFDLLGSGPFVPRDPDRDARDDYAPIDWHLDPVRALRFPRGVPHKQWNLPEMRPGNADIKFPWEIARCQHWVVLAQAFRFTRDDRFAVEIARELDDFVEANPTGIGVNWTCTMDVGLRAVSWAMALEAVHASPALDDEFWCRAYGAMHDHGVFIRNNLENTYEVTSNHFLSNLLGLLFLGRTLEGAPVANQWTAFSRGAIEQEMRVQVLADGADYESSIPYHRLVAELFLGTLRLTDHAGAPMSDAFRSRVRDMIAFLAAVIRPDGLMPQVGDADDGRLHILEGYATTPPQDPRHLFGPASAIFGDASWAALGGPAGAWEAVWWGVETSTPARATRDAARLFPHAGIATASSDAGHYLIVTNGVVGTNGFGNHKHNDLLSFEYHCGGAPLVVDPGSYVYTPEPEARNRFRGTASHNTMMVDATEQNELRPDWLFRMFETSHAETIAFEDTRGVVRYCGRHHGYERLADPVTHERTFTFERKSGALTIVDRLLGRGRHRLLWHFHLAPGVRVQEVDLRTLALTSPAGRWLLQCPPALAVQSVDAAYSPSYGVRVPCVAIDLSLDVELGGDDRWEFSITS